MIEVEGVNGNIGVKSGNIFDLIVETVNTIVIFDTTSENLSVSLVNRDVLLTIKKAI